jgi:hypothetical protein
MPDQPKERSAKKRLDLADGPTKYVDRPANEGKHGDGEEEANEGFPTADNDGSDPAHPQGQG